MRAFVRVVVVLFAILSCGCSRDLSRGQAQELISKRFSLPAAETTSIPKLTLFNVISGGSNCGVTICSYQGSRLEDLKPTLFPLQDLGLISVGQTSQTTPCCFYGFTTWSLTDKGRPYLVRETDEAFLVRTHTLVFGEVTGIQTMGQLGAAEVSYTLKVQDITPFGSSSTPGSISRTASFSRFDDGWRIK